MPTNASKRLARGKQKTSKPSQSSSTPERLHKYLARAGVASRRACERLIAEGRVQVNGQTVTGMGFRVNSSRDQVSVDGRPVQAKGGFSYFLFYKPNGVVTTMSDPQRRPAVSDYVGDLPHRVFPVGRLDYDAEGALLLTNDGDLAHRLLHPRFAVPRVYLAKVKGTPSEPTLKQFREGIRLEDGTIKPRSVAVFLPAKRNTWLRIEVSEGRTHLIKRLCSALGHSVARLFRVSYGGIQVGRLRPGQIRPLTDQEVEQLRGVASGKRQAAQPILRLPPPRVNSSPAHSK